MSNIFDNIEDVKVLSEDIRKTKRLPRNIICKKWILMKNGEEILCGSARRYNFKSFDEIGNKSIKTFKTQKEAISYVGNHILAGIKIASPKVAVDSIEHNGIVYSAIEVEVVIK